MRKARWIAAVTLIAALAVTMGTLGCGSTAPTEEESGGKAKAGKKAEPKKALTALKADGTGTLKGKVTLEGTAPTPKPIDFTKTDAKADIPVCQSGSEDEKTEPKWRVGPNKGVANVVVWVQPPAGTFFNLTDEQRKPARPEVKIDQPHCAFVPHVEVVFPSYFDGKEQKPTGQKFMIVNSATINHNAKWIGGNSLINSGDNKAVSPKIGMLEVKLVPSKSTETGKEDVATINCTIHAWMNAYAWAFDHPFAAVTDREGNYEIKGVPAADLTVKYWHETFDKTPKSDKVTVKGDTTKDFTVSAK